MSWILLRVKAGGESDLRARVQSAGASVSPAMVQSVFVTPRPGYLLLRLGSVSGVDMSRVIDAVRATPGVLNVVGHGDVPMFFAASYVKAMLAGARGEFRKGDMVRVLAGPFLGYQAEVEALIPEQGLVRVLVTIFGRQAPIELEEWQIGKAEEV
jgi:transcription antitermination factor NusG